MGQVTCERTGHYTEDYVDGTVKLRNKDWKAETKKRKRTIKTYHVFKSFALINAASLDNNAEWSH